MTRPFRPFVEMLEDRITPYTINNAGPEGDGDLTDNRADTGNSAVGYTGKTTPLAAAQQAGYNYTKYGTVETITLGIDLPASGFGANSPVHFQGGGHTAGSVGLVSNSTASNVVVTGSLSTGDNCTVQNVTGSGTLLVVNNCKVQSVTLTGTDNSRAESDCTFTNVTLGGYLNAAKSFTGAMLTTAGLGAGDNSKITSSTFTGGVGVGMGGTITDVTAKYGFSAGKGSTVTNVTIDLAGITGLGAGITVGDDCTVQSVVMTNGKGQSSVGNGSKLTDVVILGRLDGGKNNTLDNVRVTGTASFIGDANYITGSKFVRDGNPGFYLTLIGKNNVVEDSEICNVSIQGDSNQLHNNFIGIDRTGSASLGSSQIGVYISGVSFNVLSGNVISGHTQNAVSISDRPGPVIAQRNWVIGNYIGTAPGGATAVGNGGTGVSVGGTKNTLIDNNVIAACATIGISVGGATVGAGVLSFPDQIEVVNNLIGTNKAGTAALGNGSGLQIGAGAKAIVRGNLISGNTREGVRIFAGAGTGNPTPTVAEFKQNVIGSDGSKTVALGNGTGGLVLEAVNGITIGGPGPADANYILANAGQGVGIQGDGNKLTGNYIGTNGAGAALGNTSGGVFVSGSNNVIGGDKTSTDPAAGNWIAFNGAARGRFGHGVQVIPGFGTNLNTGNAIRFNHIFENEGLGIDLGGGGPNRNDHLDADGGPNAGQNAPTLIGIGPGANLRWMLNSKAGKAFVIDVYTDPDNNTNPGDATAFTEYAEGREHKGTFTVNTNANGHVEFTTTAGTEKVTVTATDADGNTSEFSLLDSDADGLPDVWEKVGIDINYDGTADYKLPGANPLKKDVYVEVDAMARRAPTLANLARVQQAFADAPAASVRNPDGSRGITLHLNEFDATTDGRPQGVIEITGDPVDFPDFRGQNFGAYKTYRDQHYGPSGSDELKAAYALVYRYALFANTAGDPAVNRRFWQSTGHSAPRGRDIIITLGQANTGGSVNMRTGAFMHELGHSLGLGHSGPMTWTDFMDADPPFAQLGVMNYARQYPGSKNGAGQSAGFANWALVYSRANPDEWAAPAADAAQGASPILAPGMWFVFREDPWNQGAENTPEDPHESPYTPEQFDQSELAVFGTSSGSTVTFTVFNGGPTPEPNATVTIPLPAGVTVTSVNTSRGTATIDGGTIRVQLGFMDWADDITVTVALATTPATLTASVGGTVADSDPTNNSFTITVDPTVSPPPPPGNVAQSAAVGGSPNGAVVPLAASNGAYNSGAALDFFPGKSVNVRVATADVNGDGVLDFIGGTGPGTATQVVVIDGKTGATLASFAPFEASFVGGVFVAASDMDGDGKAEVVVSPDQGGGPLAAVYSGAKLSAGLTGDDAQLLRYFAIDDKTFFGGARPTLGDLNGDGKPELTVSAGFLGGPRITVWDGASILAGTPVPLLNFFAFENSLRNGAFVSAGDVNGDGRADLIFGGGPGGAPRVRVFDGVALLGAGAFSNLDEVEPAQRANFFAGDSSLRGGVRLAMRDVNADGKADLMTGSGEGEASRVRVFLAGNLLANASPTADQELDPFGAVLPNGVFVG